MHADRDPLSCVDWRDTKSAEMGKLLRAKPKKAAAKPAPAVVQANGKGNSRTAVCGNYA